MTPFVAAFLLLVVSVAQAASLDLSNLVLNNIDGRIQVRFGLSIPNTAPLEAVFAEGGLLALRLEAKLSVKSEYLWDRQVAETTRLTLVRKVGGDYVVEPAPAARPGQAPGEPRPPTPPLASGPDLADVLRRAFGETTLDLGSWAALKRGDAYVLGLSISLGRGDVSAFWRNALFFWSFDVLPKARFRLDFTY